MLENEVSSEIVSYTDYNVVSLTETWMKELCEDHNLFPKNYIIL